MKESILSFAGYHLSIPCFQIVQGGICNTDDTMLAVCSDEVNHSQVPALILMSYAR